MPTKLKHDAVKPRAREMFEDNEVYTPDEIAERLKARTRQARRWIDEQKIDPAGVIELPQGRRVYGWALNDFIAGRTPSHRPIS